jgi:catechol 2,3-dioxygenase-like lactoylglutathione lyase family enzyme
VVDDLAAATVFVELGLVLQGEGARRRSLGGSHHRARRRTGGHCDDANAGRQWTTRAGEVPLAVKAGRQPTRAGEQPGCIRHIAFAVEDIDAVVAGLRARGAELVGELERYEDSYRLCYVRGPKGIIIELAERIG